MGHGSVAANAAGTKHIRNSSLFIETSVPVKPLLPQPAYPVRVAKDMQGQRRPERSIPHVSRLKVYIYGYRLRSMGPHHYNHKKWGTS
jgi:hypothetical protein